MLFWRVLRNSWCSFREFFSVANTNFLKILVRCWVCLLWLTITVSYCSRCFLDVFLLVDGLLFLTSTVLDQWHAFRCPGVIFPLLRLENPKSLLDIKRLNMSVLRITTLVLRLMQSNSTLNKLSYLFSINIWCCVDTDGSLAILTVFRQWWRFVCQDIWVWNDLIDYSTAREKVGSASPLSPPPRLSPHFWG